MEDKRSIKPMLEEQQMLFGKGKLASIAADKGYYSKANCDMLQEEGIAEIGLQKPGRVSISKASDIYKVPKELINRRAGIEALIGHLKNKWQLGRGRIKSDTTTLSSAFALLLAFNVHQLMRNLNGKCALIT